MVIDILLVIIILQIGLTSGLLFIFAFAVNPGLARLSEEEYFRAMKYINIVILNPIFFLETSFAKIKYVSSFSGGIPPNADSRCPADFK
mgnify:CR=1 FL=1